MKEEKRSSATTPSLYINFIFSELSPIAQLFMVMCSLSERGKKTKNELIFFKLTNFKTLIQRLENKSFDTL